MSLVLPDLPDLLVLPVLRVLLGLILLFLALPGLLVPLVRGAIPGRLALKV